MKRTNWSSVSKRTKLIKRNVKNIQAASEYLQNIPGEGYFKDNISKNIVKISECKTSSLRRYEKLLENYFYLVTSEKDRSAIRAKQVEIQNELALRDDAIISNVDDDK